MKFFYATEPQPVIVRNADGKVKFCLAVIRAYPSKSERDAFTASKFGADAVTADRIRTGDFIRCMACAGDRPTQDTELCYRPEDGEWDAHRFDFHRTSTEEN